MTATTRNGVGADLPDYDDLAVPLVKQTSLRIPATAYALLKIHSLTENKSEGHILRRWLWRGAMAEGVNLQRPY